MKVVEVPQKRIPHFIRCGGRCHTVPFHPEILLEAHAVLKSASINILGPLTYDFLIQFPYRIKQQNYFLRNSGYQWNS